MLVKAHLAAQHLQKIDPAVRLYLFGGPDDAGARALRDQLVATIGADAERVDISPQQLRDVPSILADEAASISLFGGQRWVSVSIAGGGGDEMVAATENLLAISAGGAPVIATVGGLTDRSRLARLVDKTPSAIAVICYPPDARDLPRIITDLAATHNLSLEPGLARTIADAVGSDRGILAQEVAKLALYCDAAPDNPVRATIADWQAIGADTDNTELGPVIDASFGGKPAKLPAVLAELDAADAIDIRLVRALMTRAQLLARLRVGVDQGQRPAAVVEAQGRAIFWKDKGSVTDQLGRWDGPRLARAIGRLHSLERELKAPHSPGSLLVKSVLLNFARSAAQSR